MNLAGFRTAVERRSGHFYDPTAETEIINEALAAVSNEENWPWLQGTHTFTTTGVGAYSMPLDCSQIRYVTVDGNEYVRCDPVDVDTLPTVRQWTVWGEQLLLPVSTGATVVVRYHKDEDPLVNDTDEPLMPPEFHGAVVDFALALVLDRAGAGDSRASYLTLALRVNGAKASYQDWLRRMRRVKTRQAGPRAPRVRPGSML